MPSMAVFSSTTLLSFCLAVVSARHRLHWSRKVFLETKEITSSHHLFELQGLAGYAAVSRPSTGTRSAMELIWRLCCKSGPLWDLSFAASEISNTLPCLLPCALHRGCALGIPLLDRLPMHSRLNFFQRYGSWPDGFIFFTFPKHEHWYHRQRSQSFHAALQPHPVQEIVLP